MAWEVQISFPYFTGLPEDVVVNTWHFLHLGGVAPVLLDYQHLETVLQAFYSNVFNDAGLASMAPFVNVGATTMKIYDLTQPTPRVPVYLHTSSWAITQATNSPLPPEVALVMSYQAAKVPGLNQASRRGRVFLGGLGNCVTVSTGANFPVPTSKFVTNIATQAPILNVNAVANDWQWVVWSRKLQNAQIVTDGWVDNAWDTQRRRGQDASARTTW